MGEKKGSSDKEKKREGSPGAEDSHKGRFCRFPLLVALLQLLLGVAVTVVAFLMLAISPSLLARETPHWAGIIVSSLFSFCLLTCLRVFRYLCMTLGLYPISCCPPSRARRWRPTCLWQIAMRKSLAFLHAGRTHAVRQEANLSAAVLYPDGTPDLCRPYSSFNFSNLSLKIPRSYVLIKYHFRVNSPNELHASPEPEVSPVLWGQHVNLVKQFTGFRIWREI